MAYFDLHAHPVLKAHLSGTHTANRRPVWANEQDEIPKASVQVLFMRDILRHQANLYQLQQGEVNLSVSVHHSPEVGMVQSDLFHTVARHIPAFVNPDLLREVARVGEPGQRTYFDHLRDSLDLLPDNLRGPQGQYVRVLRRLSDYKPEDLNIIRAIEGAHCLFSDPAGLTAADNLLRLLTEGHRFLYLTLAHLTDNYICTHAFGMRMKVGPMPITRHPGFYPRRAGLTTVGADLIRVALRAGVLIDVKHMSRESRLQYYALRTQEFTTAPIIFSHGAATGCSARAPRIRKALPHRTDPDLVVVHYHQGGLNPGVTPEDFNCWSINLYDEDIQEIVRSRGLIGLSLDKRIAGVNKTAKEIFSRAEYELIPERPLLENPRRHAAEDADVADEEDLMADDAWAEDQEMGRATPDDDAGISWLERTRRRHLKFLAYQILYMVRVGGPATWRCLCIGSDFDGLIAPLRCSRSALDFDDVEDALVQRLAGLADGKWDPADALNPNNVRERVRDLLWRNAWRFLERHFNDPAP
ncbi:Membrane dipeptidase (Peptidase family M19) [Hymenobacter daecheongensis DSM 21074]|uniref:Membrane dipeptidase (Peptidase family M19) n=1 Tax=Hymenobacter daecheongensis DSM 21074 TaxID=1121955 RepID=A0A1M6IRP6_9BACT|nr:membrane dipeptidase [Hymenobacter daecheongensis]SHJ37146.1 Membrane dipeptidase (Peptidase family M19) [Hymenobacter daecheongensis DSM 21074]